MPVIKTKQRLSRKPGPRINSGIRKQIRRRRQSRQLKNAKAQPIGTIHTIELAPKGGTDVFFKMQKTFEGYRDEKPDLKTFHDSLMKSLKIAAGLFDYKDDIADNLHLLMDYQFAVDYILRTIKKVIPIGFQYNIDYCSTHVMPYQFVIYREITTCGDSMASFEIKKTVLKLKKHNKKLHDLFISFLRCFKSSASIKFWYSDDYPIEWMEENVHNMDEDDKAPEQACIDEYKKGLAKEYEGLIREAAFVDPDKLLRQALKFDKRNPIVKIIIKGCEFLKLTYNVDSFHYDDVVENEYGDSGLRFYNQSYVGWAFEDSHTYMYDEYIQTDANEGIIPPCINAFINNKTRKDLADWLHNGLDWPLKLGKFTDFIREQMTKYE